MTGLDDQILPPTSNEEATAAEIAILTAAGLAPDRPSRPLPAPLQGMDAPKWLSDYGGSSLLLALRTGYAHRAEPGQPDLDVEPPAAPPAPATAGGVSDFERTGLQNYPPLNLHLLAAHAHPHALTLDDEQAQDLHAQEHLGSHDPASLDWNKPAVLDTIANAAADGTPIEDLVPHLRAAPPA